MNRNDMITETHLGFDLQKFFLDNNIKPSLEQFETIFRVVLSHSKPMTQSREELMNAFTDALDFWDIKGCV